MLKKLGPRFIKQVKQLERRLREVQRRASQRAHGADKAGRTVLISLDPCQLPEYFKGPMWEQICGRKNGM